MHWGMERTLRRLSTLLPEPRASLLAEMVRAMSDSDADARATLEARDEWASCEAVGLAD